VPDEERIRVEHLNPRFVRVWLSFGYMEPPNVPKALTLVKKHGLKYDIMTTSFFLGRRSLRPDARSRMPGWQDRLYIALTKSASDATSYYRLPRNRVLELGQQLSV
jgi:KUP system potassium uptake protein